MNRRTLITVFGAGITSGQQLVKRTSIDAKATVQQQSSWPLESLFPTAELLPPEYHDPAQEENPHGGERGRETVSQRGWHAGRHRVSRRFVHRTPEVAPKREVRIFASLQPENGRTADHLDGQHDIALREAFSGREPGLDYFTEWVDASLETDDVDGHRRTIHQFRAPQLFVEPDDTGQPSGKPFYEYTLILQSTDWGLLEVEVDHQDEPDAGRTKRLARQVMAYMRSKATDQTPSPSVSTRGVE